MSSVGDMADSLSQSMTAQRQTIARQLPSGGPQLSQRTAFNMGHNAPPIAHVAAASARMTGDDDVFNDARSYAFGRNNTSLQTPGRDTILPSPSRGSSTQMDHTGGVGQLRGQTKLYDPPDTNAGGTQGSAGKVSSGEGSSELVTAIRELIAAVEANTAAQGGGGMGGSRSSPPRNGKQSGQDNEGLLGIAVSQFYGHIK